MIQTRTSDLQCQAALAEAMLRAGAEHEDQLLVWWTDSLMELALVEQARAKMQREKEASAE